MLRKSVNSCSVTFVKESKGSIFIHVPIIELNKNYSWFLLHKRLYMYFVVDRYSYATLYGLITGF